MRSFTPVCVAVASLSLTACASLQPLPASADFGPPPVGFEAAITARMAPHLKDSESARYRFGPPRKGYRNQPIISGGEVSFVGYIVPFQINAKNGFGGYNGFKPYQAMVYGGSGGVYGVDQGANHPLIHVVE